MPVEVEGSLLRTARAQYRSFCKVLERKSVYSRFELDPNGVLQCVFSPEPGVLLGETVRDWLLGGEDSSPHFLWCEKFGDSEFALVYVLDGRVCREVFVTPRIAQMEVEQLVRRGRVHDPDFRVFLCDLEPAEVGLDGQQAVSLLDRSVLDRAKTSRSDLPKVSSFGRALSRISNASRLRRILIAVVTLLAALLTAYYSLQSSRFEDVEVVALPGLTKHQLLVQEYNDLLATGSADRILQALHGTLAQFLKDPMFGAYWLIEEVQWRRGDFRMQVQARLLKGDHPEEDEGESLSEARQGRLREAAEARGWTLTIDDFSGTFQLPVEWNSRTQEEISALSLGQPLSRGHRWHVERLAEDMKLIGELETGGRNTENRVYRTQSLTLKLSQDPWPTGETARWLGLHLAGSPVSLDAVSLRSVSKGTGALMDGEIRFRLIWRVAHDTPLPVQPEAGKGLRPDTTMARPEEIDTGQE